ncbi:hypothetical protein B5M42_014200 [Paenibacillus athensensis]|uniref:Sporulation protein n=1 Tax=Paenibacillus athensensis TaxID=1967502 RepID=A0A4Y8Q8H8_9BACL|nr:hypothetical protein [Paenibacillus athensensis]MCD1259965.1 hypothetical protein [Paenibacillus athensensis]
MFHRTWKLALLAAALTAASGCGAASSGFGAASGSGNSVKAKQAYPQDGYMGLTSVNPNNPLDPTYHHYRDDTDLMKAVLAQLNGIADSRIVLNGPVASVRITPKPELTPAQVEDLRTQVKLALNTNMPRYTIKVVMNGR